jgi:hypothetical protein
VTPLASPVAERDPHFQARRGLAIYFAVLALLSAALEALMILGNLSWFWALMWSPAAASLVARIALREGFVDVSFHIGGRRGWNAIALALIFPIVIGLVSYGVAWTTGLVRFHPQPLGLAARFLGDTAGPTPPDHAGGKVLLDAVGRGRGRGAQEPRLELLAVGPIVDPFA